MGWAAYPGDRVIGWYVHHHGVGHTHRAESVIRALDCAATVFSSRPAPDTHAAHDWIVLPMDVADESAPEIEPVDVTAGGAMHWAPLRIDGLTARMATIAEWIARERPSVFVVDVSVEVAVLVRLMGVPTVVMAMPGDRADRPHQTAYAAATHVVAPWSRAVYRPGWLSAFDDKVTYVGAISRFSGRPRLDPGCRSGAVVVLGAAGGSSLTATRVREWSDACDDYEFVVAGVDGSGWIDDVWPALCSASAVVTHAGQNAVADIAAARRPAILVPQERPFDEQRHTARAVARSGLAVVCDAWPTAADVAALIARAEAIPTDRWSMMRGEGAARRAAVAIAQAAQ